MKFFFTNECLVSEKRGGFRQTVGNKEITNSIVNFICQYKGCVVLNYGSGKIVRVYLSPELNVEKLLRNWKLHRNQDKMDFITF